MLRKFPMQPKSVVDLHSGKIVPTCLPSRLAATRCQEKNGPEDKGHESLMDEMSASLFGRGNLPRGGRLREYAKIVHRSERPAGFRAEARVGGRDRALRREALGVDGVAPLAVARQLLRQGEDVEIVRQLLRHKKISTTVDFYLDTDEDAKSAAAARVGHKSRAVTENEGSN